MDDLLITLPCGFKCNYKEIFDKQDKFSCPVCKSHEISTEECFNMTRNKLKINQTKLDLQQQSLCEKLKNLQHFKIDPSFHIDENYSQLKNQIDLRREEIKILLNKKIDDYCENLFLQIDQDKQLKLNEFKKKIDKLDSERELDTSNNIPKNLDINSKLDLIDEKLKNLDNKINDIDKTIAILNDKSLVLNQSSQSWDVAQIFGELGPQLEFNPVKDAFQTETTFQLLVKNFSKFKEGKILETYSKPVRIENFEWSIHVKQTKQFSGKMALECCLKYRTLTKHNELPLNLTAEIRLLNQSHPDKHLVIKFKNFEKNDQYGYSYLMLMDEILEPEKGFYTISTDTITIEAWVKQYFKSSATERESSNESNLNNEFLNREDSDSYEDIDSGDSSSDLASDSDSEDSTDLDTDSDTDDSDLNDTDTDYSDFDSEDDD